jgi:hypothetical protein
MEKNKENTNKPAEKNTKEKIVFKAGFVDASILAEAEAKMAGQKNMTETADERNEGRFKKLLRRAWKQNLFKEYYTQKEILKAKKRIEETGNIYVNETDEKNFSDEALGFVVQRFIDENQDEMLSEKEKESLKRADSLVEAEIKDLIKKYASDSSMSKEAFEEQKNRAVAGLKTTDKLSPKVYADNLFQIAEEVKKIVANGQSLEDLDFDIELNLGKAQESIKTEEKLNTFEKTIKKLNESRIGAALINETTITIGATLFAFGPKLITGVVRSKAAQIATLGAGLAIGATVAGVKENYRVKQERAQHIRESARGMEFNESDMERRKEMEKNRYETENAKELADDLKKGLEKIKSGVVNQDEYDQIITKLAEIESRIEIADTKKIDLISYTNYSTVEKERFELDKTRAEIKVALKRAGYTDYSEKVNSLSGSFKESINKDVGEKDKTFNKLKNKRVAIKVATAVIAGATLGLAVQEVKSFFTTGEDGLVEALLKKTGLNSEDLAYKATVLEGLRRHIFNDHGNIPFGNGFTTQINGETLNIPEGSDLVKNTDGTFNLIHNGNTIAENLPIEHTPDGELTTQTKEILAQNGITSETFTTSTETTQTISASDYIEKHLDETKRITRDWMGNDTEMYRDPETGKLLGADLNEIRGQWGGVDGKGLDENGNYVFNCKTITNDGSFLGDTKVLANDELKSGNLVVLLSATKGTQNFVFEIPIDTNGNAIIDPNSTAGKMLFSIEDDKAVFKGAFAEIAKPMETLESGAQKMRILGTLEGTDQANQMIETVGEDIKETKLNIQNTDVQVPPVLSVLSRRPLERGEYKDPVELKNKEQEEIQKKKEEAEKIEKEEEEKNSEEEAKTTEEAQETVAENPTLKKLLLEAKTKKEIKLSENAENIRERNDLEMINKSSNSKFSNFKEKDFTSEYAKNIFKEIQKDPELSKDGLKNMGDLLENKLTNTENKKEYSYKEILSEIPLVKKEREKAFVNKETSIALFLENKINSLEKQKGVYEELMSEYREELKEAEKARKEDKVLEIEDKIRILEKESFGF